MDNNELAELLLKLAEQHGQTIDMLRRLTAIIETLTAKVLKLEKGQVDL